MVKTRPAWMSRTERLLERTAKHGALPIGLLLCIISFYLDGPENLWFWYLPPFVFYSLAYIFGRNSTNEGVITTQIMISLIFMPIIVCLHLIAVFPIMFLTSIFVLFLTYVYILALYLTLARQAFKAPSKESDRLRKRCFYRVVLCFIGDAIMWPIIGLLLPVLPSYGKDIYENRNDIYTVFAVLGVIKALVNCGFLIIILCYPTRKSLDAKTRKSIFFIDVNDNGCGQKKNDTVTDVHQWWNKCNLFEAKHSRIQPEKLILPL